MPFDQLNKYDAKILVIDDERLNLDVIDEVLDNAGFSHVTLTASPYDGIELYKQIQPDIVLLDINMPEMDGFEVLAQFKQHAYKNSPPVLVLTAQGDIETCLRVLSSGAKDFLGKPFHNKELVTRIGNLLDMHFALKQNQQYNIILEERVQEKTRELQKTQREIIDRLGYAAEYRDTETAKHTQRVGELSKILALSLGLSQQEADIISYAAPMHDLGKIGIPDRILLKEGKLNSEEWSIMQTHALVGAEILKDATCDILRCARIIALTHHEKWDGSGYPNALNGDDIPLLGQIVAIVDVFDALTSVRAYKKAWTIEAASQLINEQTGKHFSLGIVNAFNQNLQEFIAVKQRLLD